MIIFDLDGTLADCEHRRHFVSEDHWNKLRGNTPPPIPHFEGCWKPDWKAFYEACDQDKPIKPTIDILEYIGKAKEYGFDTPWVDFEGIEIWSGRCESVREKTEKWLNKHVEYYYPDKIKLKMRPIGDNTPDDQLKEMWLHDAMILEGKEIDFVFDDRPKVVRMWRRHGIFVFNCCQHEKEF